MQFSVELADINVQIETQAEYVRKRFERYIAEGHGPAAFSAEVLPREFAAEKEKPENSDVPDGLLEMSMLHCKITDMLASYGVCAAHGSCFAMDGRAYLFMAPSGTGKSTHARLWRERYGSRITVINDDKPYLSARDGEVRAWGSPWSGKHRLDNPCSAPLCGICMLERAETNRVHRLKQEDAFCRLLPFFHFPADREQRPAVLKTIREIALKVPVYLLGCNMDPEAAEVAYRALSAEEYRSEDMK